MRIWPWLAVVGCGVDPDVGDLQHAPGGCGEVAIGLARDPPGPTFDSAGDDDPFLVHGGSRGVDYLVVDTPVSSSGSAVAVTSTVVAEGLAEPVAAPPVDFVALADWDPVACAGWLRDDRIPVAWTYGQGAVCLLDGRPATLSLAVESLDDPATRGTVTLEGTLRLEDDLRASRSCP